jgi:hypothetical protein
MRKMTSNWIAEKIKIRLSDKLLESRPMLHFLKPLPEKGHHPNKDKSIPLLQDKRFEVARRKSVSSGYLRTYKRMNGGGGGGEGDEMDDIVFDSSSFSSSTPSILMPSSYDPFPNSSYIASSSAPPVPLLPRSLRPMSSLMDIEGSLIPNLTRRSEAAHHLDEPYFESKHTKIGHWHMYDQ